MIRTSIPRWACGFAALLVASGCGSLDLNLTRGDRDVRAVKEIVCLWEPGEGVGLDGLPTRGFAGQLLFFKPGSDVPVRVDGDVRIYVFDDQGTMAEQSRPLHEFDFPSAVWQAFAHDTNLGPAYQIFVPYTRKGHNFADCAIRVRFTAKDQLPVYSKMANVALSGRRTVKDPAVDQPEEQAQSGSAAAGNVDLSTASPIEPLQMPMTAMPQFDRLHRAAAGAVEHAEYVETDVSAYDDEESETASARRYRMNGRVQQASAVVE